MSRSSRVGSIILALALAALAWLIWSLVRISTPERAVSPAEDPVEAVAEVEAGASRDVVQPAERGDTDLPDLGSAVASVQELPRADLIGRVEGLELPHGYGEVRVALWPDGLQPDCRQLASAGADTFPLRVVAVAPDGSFRFDGLPSEGTFQLRAGGAAHVSFPLEQAVQPSAAVVVLRLVRIKGLEIEIVGRDGEALRTHPDLVLPGASFGGAALMDPGALLDTWEEQLAAVPGAGCDAPEPKLGVRFLLRGPTELSALGPIACDLRVAGYGPVSRLLWAEPVLGSIPKTRVELETTATGWGSLELRLNGWGAAIRDEIAPDAHIGAVYLRYADGKTLQIPVRGADASRTWQGIPQGRTEASFRSTAMYQWPRDGSTLALEIAEHLSTLDVDLSDSGALRVGAPPAQGESIPHDRSFALRWSSRFGVVPLTSRNLPTLLPVVEPGEWSLFEMRGPGAPPSLAPREGIRVVAGAITELSLDVD
jgi:hypothetical protein